MKEITLFGLLLCSMACLAQSPDTEFKQIVEAERKAASRFTHVVTNINTANYDVTHQELRFTVNPAMYFITGIVTTEFTALSSMSTITFDLNSQLDVTSVTQNGVPLTFTQNNNDELVITLPSTLAAGQQGLVTVNYNGIPGFDNGAFTVTSHNGSPILSTLSEPYGAKDWWPCKQDLNDKIQSLDVYITAPSQYVSVSNGLEISQTTSGNNKTTHFHHSYPIPAYLVAIAVSNYSIFTQQAGTATTFPVVNYIYPESLVTAQQELAATPSYIALFEQLFEPYPFSNEKYGHAQWNTGGGMEHTTVSFVNSFGRELISHELAHQWFGDKVTCGTWKDIWLNEGFATYLSGLVVEHQDGNDPFTSWKDWRINDITSEPGGSVYLTDADTLDTERIFSSRLSYNKGAMVLHMLRFKLGDEAFFQGIREYLADPDLAYAYAHTDDLQWHLENASGEDLDEFFNDWVYNQGFPIYNIVVQYWAPHQFKIKINQSQSHPSVGYFEMPVPIRLFGPSGEVQDVVLENLFDGQEFIVPVPFDISSAEFNPERDIISNFNTTTLGTGNFDRVRAITLYPNPVSGQLNLVTPEGITVEEATIYNVLGQQVLHSENTTSWNISALSPGVHFITIVTNEGTCQLKFIKQ